MLVSQSVRQWTQGYVKKVLYYSVSQCTSQLVSVSVNPQLCEESPILASLCQSPVAHNLEVFIQL